MKIALSVWKDCISTVFDAADQLLVLEKDGSGALKRSALRFTSADGSGRVMQLKNAGIDVLICGAISRPQEAAILASRITVHSFARGTVQDIIAAYETGRLNAEEFALPGCRRRARGSRCPCRSI